MKNLPLFIFLICNLSVFASKKYVATTGNDRNPGTQASPYLTVKYGVEHSTDTCFINSGNYNLPNFQILVHAGIKLVGADSSNTILNCTYTTSGTFGLWSATAAIGNNSFYNLKFEGNRVAYAAIYVTRRSNITLNRCVIQNFNNSAIIVTDALDDDSPGISGIVITNCQFINSSSYFALGSGGIVWLRGTKDGTIANNIISASYRTGDSAGFGLKMSHLENYSIHDNVIKVLNHDDASKWIFAAELNHILGGVEVYNNTIEGIFDIAGHHCQKGKYSYSLSFHNNLFGTQTLTSMYKYGLQLENIPNKGELEMSDVLIYNNTFRNLSRAIICMLYPQTVLKKISIYYNVFYNIGWNNSKQEGNVFSCMGPGKSNIRDIYIDNNTIMAAEVAGGSQGTAINLPERGCTTHNFRIRNNIIQGFDHSPVETGNLYPTGIIDSLYILNNDFFQNGNSNDPFWHGITPSHIFSSGGIKDNPLFVSSYDFRLQPDSPDINAGKPVGFSADITGNSISGNPDIGAYEYHPSSPSGKVGLLNGNSSTFNDEVGKQ
jgi:hypothetical protein